MCGVYVPQVGLTRRPLCENEECGNSEDANLAAGHAGSSIAVSRVVPHGAGSRLDAQDFPRQWANSYLLGRDLVLFGRGPTAVALSALLRRHQRPVKEIALQTALQLPRLAQGLHTVSLT